MLNQRLFGIRLCPRGLLVTVLVVCLLCAQSLASVLPAFGEVHHHETDLAHGHPHEHPHDSIHEQRAALAANGDQLEAVTLRSAPAATPAHWHATDERHRHGALAGEDDVIAQHAVIDQLLDDLMQCLGNVATALSGETSAGLEPASYVPVRVAHPGIRLRGRSPDLPFRPPIA